jgi:stage II sporulation protein R
MLLFHNQGVDNPHSVPTPHNQVYCTSRDITVKKYYNAPATLCGGFLYTRRFFVHNYQGKEVRKMRKIVYLAAAALLAGLVIAAAAGNAQGGSAPRHEYIRIHIRANSNGDADQTVKYYVKECVVAALTPALSECATRDDAERVLRARLPDIVRTAEKALRDRGFAYGAAAELDNEYFPARRYDDTLTLGSGFYDALIIRLGSGGGDNWWCVVYPPLCFVNSEYTDGAGVRYKSKLKELVEKVLGG